MPEMDGFEATTALRAREAQSGRHIPIIAMTAHAMKGDQKHRLDSGMDAYVTKPIKPSALFAAIESACCEPAPQQQLRKLPTSQTACFPLLCRGFTPQHWR